jgi:hypothetical protein
MKIKPPWPSGLPRLVSHLCSCISSAMPSLTALSIASPRAIASAAVMVLVFFYYSKAEANNNGNTPWLSCGQQSILASSSECTYQRPIGTEEGGGWIYSPVLSVAWLSAEHECAWTGISCITVPLKDGSGSYWESVSAIQIGTFAWGGKNRIIVSCCCCCCWAQCCSFRFHRSRTKRTSRACWRVVAIAKCTVHWF